MEKVLFVISVMTSVAICSAKWDACGAACASFFSQSDFIACLREAFPLPGRIVLPSDPDYDVARTLTNIRVSRKPAAVVYAKNTSDVVGAVQCGYRSGVPIAVVNGRHGFQGLSIVDGYLAIDTSNLTKLEVATTPTLFARVGPGITNTLFVAGLRDKAPKDAFGVIGECPSVGFGGFALGGGMGLTSRSHGLACDNVLSLEIVLYNGTIITANLTHHADVLWASCGGGGGLGVVTEFVVRLHRFPSNTFTRFSVDEGTKDIAGNIEFQITLQKWLGIAGRRLAGGASGPGAGVTGIFWGTPSEAQKAMYDAGLLHTPDQNITQCVSCGEYTSYYDMFLIEACIAVSVASRQNDKIGEIFPGRSGNDCKNNDFLYGEFANMASTPGSPISSGASMVWQTWSFYTCRLMDAPSRETWAALIGKAQPACDSIKQNTTHFIEALAIGDELASLCYAIEQDFLPPPRANHLLGGAVTEQSPMDTAYFYRGKYAPVCIGESFPSDWVGSEGQLLDTVKDSANRVVRPRRIANVIIKEIWDRLDAVYSLLGTEQASVSYINYQAPALADWRSAYFGNNVERLAEIKQSYDPLGLFSKPLIVDGTLPAELESRRLDGSGMLV